MTATDPGGLNAAQSFRARVTAPFTDDAIRSGVRGGVGRFGWTDPVLRAGVTRVRLAHLLELREALAAAYAAAGREAPGWTDAAPVAGRTPIRAVRPTELRVAVRRRDTARVGRDLDWTGTGGGGAGSDGSVPVSHASSASAARGQPVSSIRSCAMSGRIRDSAP